MSAVKRQLTGFGEFLDWRPLEFVDKIPSVFVCVICGVLAAFPRRLRFCDHVFCPLCYEKIAQKKPACPVDGRSFSKQDVEVLDSVRGGINDLTVRCPNEPRGCTFVRKLSQLQVHYLEQCCRGEVLCPRCGRSMPHTGALDHYLQDCPHKAEDEDASQKTSGASPSPKHSATKARSSHVDASRAPAGNRTTSWRSRSADSTPSGRTDSRLKSGVDIAIRQVCSADSSPAPEFGRAVTAAAANQRLRSTTSVSGGSIRSASGSIPSQRNSPMKIYSSNISEHSESIRNVPSQEARVLKKPNSAITEMQKTQPGDKATSSTTLAAASGAALPRNGSSSAVAGNKAAATALPAGFAFCYITGVTVAQSSLPTCEEVVLSSDSSRVAGCDFRVHARLRRGAFGSVHACFKLCLCGGTRETIALLLAKRLHVVLVHPWDQSRNLRMALQPNPDAVHEEGRRAGRWDFWLPTKEMKLGDVESRGFVTSGAICIAVEIE